MNTVQQLNKLFIIRIIVFVILLTIKSLTICWGKILEVRNNGRLTTMRSWIRIPEMTMPVFKALSRMKCNATPTTKPCRLACTAWIMGALPALSYLALTRTSSTVSAEWMLLQVAQGIAITMLRWCWLMILRSCNFRSGKKWSNYRLFKLSRPHALLASIAILSKHNAKYCRPVSESLTIEFLWRERSTLTLHTWDRIQTFCALGPRHLRHSFNCCTINGFRHIEILRLTVSCLSYDFLLITSSVCCIYKCD